MNEEKIYALEPIAKSLFRYERGNSDSIEFWHFKEHKWLHDDENMGLGVFYGFDDAELITEEEAMGLAKYLGEGNWFRRGEDWRSLIK